MDLQFKKSLKRILVCATVAVMMIGNCVVVFSQELNAPLEELPLADTNPPMRNIFLNVLWGSLAGGTVWLGYTTLDDTKDKSKQKKNKNMVGQFAVGATYGGIGGLFLGLYLSLTGIEFDPNLTRIAFFPVEEPTFHQIQQQSYAFTEDITPDPTIVRYRIEF